VGRAPSPAAFEVVQLEIPVGLSERSKARAKLEGKIKGKGGGRGRPPHILKSCHNFFRDHGKSGEICNSERRRDRNAGRSPAGRHQHPPNPRLYVARVKRLPSILQIRFEPGAEVHGRGPFTSGRFDLVKRLLKKAAARR